MSNPIGYPIPHPIGNAIRDRQRHRQSQRQRQRTTPSYLLPLSTTPEQLAAEIAAAQIRQVDELSLIGYPTSFDEITRDVVETALRLAARAVLEA